jgi:Flp pilus assembly protein TadG
MADSARRPRGQALVEFALVLPMFLTLMLAIFDIGRVIWARNSLENAAREGARYAIVHGDSIGQSCPVGPSASVYSTVPTATSACPYPATSKQSVYDQVRAYAWAAGGRPSSCTTADTTTTGPCITVCYGTSCSGDTNSTSTTIRGTSVTVTATSQIDLILPRLLGITTFTVAGTTTMLVNS